MTITIGEVRAEEGVPYRVEEAVGSDRYRIRWLRPMEIDAIQVEGLAAGSDPGGTLLVPRTSFENDPIVSKGDRKPRGEKSPLALIPWDVVPEEFRPDVVSSAYNLRRAGGAVETFASRVIRILLTCDTDERLLLDVARAFGHGAAKYGVDNWRTIAWDRSTRLEYESAMLRHLYADATGEETDPDSGLPHRAHAIASAMIYQWHEENAA